MTKSFSTSRLFFALLPDVNITSVIDFHQAQISPESGKKVKSENYHITLLFLGNVEDKTKEALCLDCENVKSPAFNLVINKSGWWPKPKILWLAPDITPSPLATLVNTLSTFAARRKLLRGKRNYFPHITLVRKISAPPRLPIIKPFTWESVDFCLMQSMTYPEGVQYKELSRWPLES